MRSPLFRAVGLALIVLALLMFLFRTTFSRPTIQATSPPVAPTMAK
jgi:hypothetical protein